MIPKKIHYVWVGDQPKSQFVLDCIETWKTYLPDYDIIEWNNERLSTIENTFAQEAFKNRKWAFVSDYLRLYALYNEGGIYLDTDVEVTQSLDQFLSLKFFSGYENYNSQYFPITPTMGAEKGSSIIEGLLGDYTNVHFQIGKELDMEPNTVKISRFFGKKFGLPEPYDGTQKLVLTEGAVIFPSYYFCAPEEDKINFTIHHFDGSWLPSHSRKDKLTIFKKLIIARYSRKKEKGERPLLHNEKILFKFPISRKKELAFIWTR